MLSTFHSLELGKRGLTTQQTAVVTVGENVANVNNPEYSRRSIQIQSTSSIYVPGISHPGTKGKIGTGSQVAQIQRVRDMFLDHRIFQEESILGKWKSTFEFLKRIEQIHGEPKEGLTTLLTNFARTWNDVGTNPKEISIRESLKSEALTLTRAIRNRFNKLMEMRQELDFRAKELINNINSKTKRLARLNEEIRKSVAEGDNPNDLLDQRDALILKLSKIINISVNSADEDDRLMIYIGSEILVQGNQYETIEAISDSNNEGFAKITWKQYETPLYPTRGSLKAILDMRDIELPRQIAKLNVFTQSVMNVVNEIHSEGFGLNGQTDISFFEKTPISVRSDGLFDRENIGENKQTGFSGIKGGNSISPDDIPGISGVLNLSGKQGELFFASYSSTDSVQNIINKINSLDSGLKAYLNYEGQLILETDQEPFIMEHIEDSGQFLTHYAGILKQSGKQGAFSSEKNSFATLLNKVKFSISPKKHPAANIKVANSILHDIQNIAAAQTRSITNSSMTGPGDGRNALRIMTALNGSVETAGLNIVTNKTQNLIPINAQGMSFQEFLNSETQYLASIANEANVNMEQASTLLNHLEQTKNGISGVNLDEELTSLLKFQRGYQASANFIRHVDEMLETLIFKLGA